MYTNTYSINVSESFSDNNKEDYVKKDYIFNELEYTIIKYNKSKLKEYELQDNDKFLNLSKFRSLVVRNNKVMCCSPPKSISFENFVNKYDVSNSWVEDFIDGTMINVFYDNVNNVWEIATKSTVGGNVGFFNDFVEHNTYTNTSEETKFNYTFRAMFFDACNYNNFDINSLDTKYCYSFVMQHPYNRIVTPTTIPLIYLIKIYEINSVGGLSNTIINEVDLKSFIDTPCYIFLNTNIKVPNKYTIDNYTNLKNYYLSKELPYYIVGVMVLNNDGSRSKIRNSNYEIVRKLRGNQSKLQYNYFCLKKENKVKDFLAYYPEHNYSFNNFKNHMYKYTNNLFTNYISCFINKEKQLKEYDFQYKNHMYKLHEIYKSNLKPNNKTIDKKTVIDYVNSLHPSQQMFVINYGNYNTNTNSNHNSRHHEHINKMDIDNQNNEVSVS